MLSQAGAVEVHPLDVNKYEKGDYVPPERCEEIVGLPRHDRRYSLRLVTVAALIERQWEEQRGEEVVVVSERDGLRICTDEQAVSVLERRRKQHTNGLKRTFRRQRGVDRSKLSAEGQSRHDRELTIGAAFIAGGEKAVRAALRPHTRSTPGLPPKR